MSDGYFLNPTRQPCARCGLVARGSAQIQMPGEQAKRYCHPDDPDAPDCYTLQCREDAGLIRECVIQASIWARVGATDFQAFNASTSGQVIYAIPHVQHETTEGGA